VAGSRVQLTDQGHSLPQRVDGGMADAELCVPPTYGDGWSATAYSSAVQIMPATRPWRAPPQLRTP
jgi:hypothetical protein